MTRTSRGFLASGFVQVLTGNRWLFGLTLVVVFALARVATWGYPFDSDHWIFYYVGQNWVVGGGDLYVDAWDHKPPMIFLFNGIMAALFGDNIVLHRIFLTALTVLDVWLFYQLAKKVMPALMRGIRSNADSATVIKLTLLLYVFLRNLSQFTSSGNNTEAFAIIFLLTMVLCYLNFVETGKWWWMLLAGCSLGILFWFKANLLLLGAVLGLFMLIYGWKNKGQLVRDVALFVLPLLLISAGWFGYFWSIGTVNDFIVASFTFSSKYAASAWSGKVSSNILLVITTAALVVPTLAFFVLYFRDFVTQKLNKSYLLIGSLLVAGLILIGAVGSFYAYYLLIVMPFVVIVLMYGMLRLPSYSSVVRVSFIGLFIFTLLLNYGISTRQLLNSFGGTSYTEAQNYQKAAAYVTAHTKPGEPVFAYDYGAVFYELAQRPSGSRFVSASVLLLDWRDGFGFGFDQLFIDEMEQSKPQYVVFNDLSRDLYLQNKPLAEYFAQHYAPVEHFGAIEVQQRVR
jgi:4-amino-4-deoxy-L-arabinose transferase-like glycosyltransferase